MVDSSREKSGKGILEIGITIAAPAFISFENLKPYLWIKIHSWTPFNHATDYARWHYRETRIGIERLGGHRIEGMGECQLQKAPRRRQHGGNKIR